MRQIRRMGLMFAVVVLCIGCDQVAKAVARSTLRSAAPMALFYETLTLTYAENPGGFLSFGAHFSEATRFVLFTLIVGGALLLGCVVLLRVQSLPTLQWFGLALSIGGGLGNLIDRFMNQGRVIDFLYLRLGLLHTGVFNIADVAVTLGVTLFALGSLWPRYAR